MLVVVEVLPASRESRGWGFNARRAGGRLRPCRMDGQIGQLLAVACLSLLPACLLRSVLKQMADCLAFRIS